VPSGSVRSGLHPVKFHTSGSAADTTVSLSSFTSTTNTSSLKSCVPLTSSDGGPLGSVVDLVAVSLASYDSDGDKLLNESEFGAMVTATGFNTTLSKALQFAKTSSAAISVASASQYLLHKVISGGNNELTAITKVFVELSAAIVEQGQVEEDCLSVLQGASLPLTVGAVGAGSNFFESESLASVNAFAENVSGELNIEVELPDVVGGDGVEAVESCAGGCGNVLQWFDLTTFDIVR